MTPSSNPETLQGGLVAGTELEKQRIKHLGSVWGEVSVELRDPVGK